MTDEEYEKHRNALIKNYLEEEKNLSEEFSRYSGQISSKYYDFRQAEHDANLVRDIPKSKLVEFFKENMLGSSPTRRKISAHMKRQLPPQTYSADDMEAMKEIAENAQIYRDLGTLVEFKKACPLAGVPKAVAQKQ